MSDVAILLNDLDVVVSILSPDMDSVKLKIRLEEVIDRYDVSLKTEESRKDDLIANIKLYISAKRLEGLSELTLQDYYRELMLFEFYVQKSMNGCLMRATPIKSA